MDSCVPNRSDTPLKISKDIFIAGEVATQKESYTNIKGNINRFKALMCGRFVQYKQNSETNERYTWLVNDNKDSVVIYHLPTGDPNKDGHWIYVCQILTSLPYQPIYQEFLKLDQVDRDTIHLVPYEIPKNLDLDFKKILENPISYFEKISWKNLKRPTAYKRFTYTRTSITEFSGTSGIIPFEDKDIPYKHIKHNYMLNPESIKFNKQVYDDTTKKPVLISEPSWLMKNAMINPDLLK